MITNEARGDAGLIDPWAVEESSSVSDARVGVESDRPGSAPADQSAVVTAAADSDGFVPDPSCAPEAEPPDVRGGRDVDLEDAGAFEDFIEVPTGEDPERLREEATYGLITESAPAELPGLDDLVDDFDPEARRSPWVLDGEDVPADHRPSEKAVTIAKLLKVRRESERLAAFAALRDLFSEYSHPATFRAIHRLCRTGVDLDTLMTTVTLRNLWLEEPCTWQRRSGGLDRPSWGLALRVAVARAEWPVEQMFDLEWLREWQTLAAGSPGYPSVAAYVEIVLVRTPGDPRWATLSRHASAIDPAVITADLSGRRRRLDRALNRADGRDLYFFDVEPGTADWKSVW